MSYADFSRVSSFEELLSNEQEKLVESKEVNELRSMIFLSQDGRYKAVSLPDRLQGINLQDLFFDEERGAIFYIGGNQELVAVRSNSMSSKAGILAQFDVEQEAFLIDRWVDFPTDINARTIIKLENGNGLIITNDGYPFLVNWPVLNEIQ